MTVPNDAAREQRRLRFLADAGALFAAPLDPDTLLRDLARLAVPDVADACIVDVVSEEGQVRRVAVAHVDPTRANRASDPEAGPPPGAQGPEAPETIRTDQPRRWAAMDDHALRALARGPGDAEALRGLGLTSAVAVPLVARGQALGSLVLASIGAARAPRTACRRSSPATRCTCPSPSSPPT